MIKNDNFVIMKKNDLKTREDVFLLEIVDQFSGALLPFLLSCSQIISGKGFTIWRSRAYGSRSGYCWLLRSWCY